MAWMITKDFKGTALEGKGEYTDESLVANCNNKFVIKDVFGKVIYEGISDQRVTLKDIKTILFTDNVIGVFSIERTKVA